MRIRFGARIGLLPLLLLFRCHAGGQGVAAGGAGDSPHVISLDVNLVVLHATVRDGKGRFVSGLGRENFRLYEDGVPQPIKVFQHEDTPVTVGLVVDHSGSMRTKLPDVLAAAETFARSSNPKDEMFVVNFNERVSMGLPEGMAFT